MNNPGIPLLKDIPFQTVTPFIILNGPPVSGKDAFMNTLNRYIFEDIGNKNDTNENYVLMESSVDYCRKIIHDTLLTVNCSLLDINDDYYSNSIEKKDKVWRNTMVDIKKAFDDNYKDFSNIFVFNKYLSLSLDTVNDGYVFITNIRDAYNIDRMIHIIKKYNNNKFKEYVYKYRNSKEEDLPPLYRIPILTVYIDREESQSDITEIDKQSSNKHGYHYQFVIDNNGTIEEFEVNIKKFYNEVIKGYLQD